MSHDNRRKLIEKCFYLPQQSFISGSPFYAHKHIEKKQSDGTHYLRNDTQTYRIEDG